MSSERPREVIATRPGEPGSGGPEVERVISERAWASFPELLGAVERWAELSGPGGSDLLVSAVPLGMDWVSVRVSRLEYPDDVPVDWIEWLAPTFYRGASPAALDHFAGRELDRAAHSLMGRTGQLKGIADFPPVPAPAPRIPEEPTMAPKSKPKTTTAAAAAPSKGRSAKPAAEAAPPAKATRARAKSKSRARPVEEMAAPPRAETRSAKPAAKPAGKPATTPAPAAPKSSRSAGPAPTVGAKAKAKRSK